MIILSALALCAAAGAGALSIISWRRTLALSRKLSTNESNLRTCIATLRAHAETLKRLNGAAPASLQAEVAELSGAVARLAKTQQRFAGKFFAETAAELGDAAAGDELAAILNLQSAPAAGP